MKFDDTIKLLYENYIQSGTTYGYTVGASKDISGPQNCDTTGYGDLGFRTNFDNVHNFFTAQMYNKAVGRHPANLEVNRYVKILRTKTLEELKPLVADLNKQCKAICKDFEEVKFEKGTTVCTLVDKIAHIIGDTPDKWKNFLKYIETRDIK